MKQLFLKIPYNRRVAIVILLFTLIPCIILGIVFLRTERKKQMQSLLSDYYSYVDTTANLTSKTISSLESKMNYLLYNFEILSYFSRIDELSLTEKMDLMHELNDAVSIISLDNSNVTARWYPVSAQTNYGEYCQTLDVLASEFPAGSSDPVFQSIVSLNINQYLWKSRNNTRVHADQKIPKDRLCLYSSFSTLNRSACVLEISLPITDFVMPLENAFPAGSILAICLVQNGNFDYFTLSASVSATEGTSLITQYAQNGIVPGYELIMSPIANVEQGCILLLLPHTYVNSLLRPQILGILLLYIVVAIVILCITYLTSHLLTRRILSAINEMKQDIATIATQPLEETTVMTDMQRIRLQVKNLVHSAQDYCHKIDYYEKENLRTELELLQMRFNPHLLYNTLAAVNHHTKDPQSRAAVGSLCNYYRVVLNNGHLIIRIQDEIEMVKEYLSVMRYTYCLEHITYHFEIEESVLECSVIKHVLQPIVENAIRHGLVPLQHDGHLYIYGKMESDYLEIQVIDNGIGMPPEETAKLLSEPAANTRGGYGIYNVQSRLQLHYGMEYGLMVESTEGKGTCVTMRIPIILE